MFKDLSKGFFKFFTTQRVILLVVFLVLGYILYTYSNTKNMSMDGYSTGMDNAVISGPVNIPNVAGTPSVAQPQPPMIGSSTTGTYKSRETGNPTDLLPKDKHSQFSDFNMLNNDNVVMPDLLDAGYLIGLDTIGQTLRNPNYQERSDPIIPKTTVGPWNNSTIEPDLGRVPMELGYGSR